MNTISNFLDLIQYQINIWIGYQINILIQFDILKIQYNFTLKINEILYWNKSYYTPLHRAILNGNIEIVKLLLSCKDINVNLLNIL